MDIYSGELTNERFKNWMYLQAAGRNGVERVNNSDFFVVKPEAVKRIDQGLAGKVFIYPNENGSKSDDVFGTIRKHIEESDHHVDVIIIDNLMALDYSGDKSYGQYDEQSRLMKAVREIAYQYNVHVHFVCHPRKQSGLLSKYDISGSANITDVAANVMAIYRNTDDFVRGWNESRPCEKVPEGNNFIVLLKSRWNGNHIGEILPLWYD